MGMMGPASNMGDFVYSQEGLDRIVSQLMEQTSTSNAPGPATQADIDALPRTNVTEEMLGEEHKAECSICMDEVNIGEQVTLLPCKHWFHHPCVSAWLLEHDTCPHCRKGITKGGEGQTNNPASADSQTDRTSQMPGSFTPSGSGTFNDPYVVPAGSPPPPSNDRGSSSDNANAGPGNGGISDRIRRGRDRFRRSREVLREARRVSRELASRSESVETQSSEIILGGRANTEAARRVSSFLSPRPQRTGTDTRRSASGLESPSESSPHTTSAEGTAHAGGPSTRRHSRRSGRSVIRRQRSA
ncbi:hypothetical protein IG631_13135 [Alternaria alternata]|nr:hypothetical protein IG631_13135 [Alternaria alternata]